MPYEMKASKLHIFQRLLAGTWANDDRVMKEEEGQTGKKMKRPYSYNVMPLPQDSPEPLYKGGHHGFILKNFRYTESISFHAGDSQKIKPKAETVAMPGGAPNRGYFQRQVPHALFYDQVVRFAEGPGSYDPEKSVVHLENGAWLSLPYFDPEYGPYPNVPMPPKGLTPITQPLGTPTFAKQISVPHGNSVLALGMYTGLHDGPPVIPVGTSLPTDIDVDRYKQTLDQFTKPPTNDRKKNDYENPHRKDTLDPLLPLREAMAHLKPTRYHHVWFSTRCDHSGLKGSVTNIPFESRMAAAIDYDAQYWLLATGRPGKDDNYKDEQYQYLAYFQNITLKLKIKGEDVLFPHVTANVIARQTKVYK